MIKSNLSTLMGAKRLNITDINKMTGLSRNTIAGLYHDKVKRVDYVTLDKLCTVLNCKVGDLLEKE